MTEATIDLPHAPRARIARRSHVRSASRAWRFWLALIAISAFGPFLDIVTERPFNWILGSLPLLFVSVLGVFEVVRPSVRMHRIPFLTIALFAFNYWYFIQAWRPGADRLNALLGFRGILVGLAAYLITLMLLLRCRNRDGLEGRIRSFATVIATVSIPVALYGIFQWAVGYERLAALHLLEPGGFYLIPNIDNAQPVFRIFSTMRRNESLGSFLCIAVMVSIAALRLPNAKRKRLVLSIILSVIALLLALSLTSIVVLALWLVMLVISGASAKAIRTALVCLIFVAIAAFAADHYTNGLLGMRIRTHVHDVREDSGRLKMFRNWVAEVRDRPIEIAAFGSGVCTGVEEGSVGRIQNVFSLFGLSTGVTPCGWSREIHDNWYATLSLETGVIGLLLLWAVTGVAMVYVFALRRRKSGPVNQFSRLIGLGILAFWPAGFVGAVTLYHPITLYFWSLVAFLEAERMLRRAEPARMATA